MVDHTGAMVEISPAMVGMALVLKTKDQTIIKWRKMLYTNLINKSFSLSQLLNKAGEHSLVPCQTPTSSPWRR